jgi:hypothetical protein
MESHDREPGFICPFCGTDCSPIATAPPCRHFFLIDGENGWRFTPRSAPLFEEAEATYPALFRDLLYHDGDCRARLRLRRANYDDALEMYVFSEDPEATEAAFRQAIARYRNRNRE